LHQQHQAAITLRNDIKKYSPNTGPFTALHKIFLCATHVTIHVKYFKNLTISVNDIWETSLAEHFVSLVARHCAFHCFFLLFDLCCFAQLAKEIDSLID